MTQVNSDRRDTESIAARMRQLVRKCTFADRVELTDLFNDVFERKTSTSIGFLNQHGYNLARRDDRAYAAFDSLDIIFRDGIGIALACRAFGIDPKANLNGTDLIPALVDHASKVLGKRAQFFAYGTKEPWLTKGAQELFDGQPFSALDGFHPADAYLKHFNSHKRADAHPVVILGMGMPMQEHVAQAITASNKDSATVICGGAILDFKAERFSRAPRAIRSLRMEWLYRLSKEPKRLFSRYVIGIPTFLRAVINDR